MSWSFSCIGKPSAVAEAIEKYGQSLTGQSKLEFEGAESHLIGLVRETFAKPPAVEPVIDFEASGSGWSTQLTHGGSAQIQRQCTVSIKPLYKTLV